MRGILAALIVAAPPAWGACPGYSVCPVVRYEHVLAKNFSVVALEADINATETASVLGLSADGLNFGQLVALLGEVLVFDRSLSATGTEPCALCHDAAAGFANGIGVFRRAGGIFPGADGRRAGYRTPQSLAYAGYAPVLNYRSATADFAGGNFWDSRATGLVTGSAAADQAVVPLTNPFEMALPDPACAVWRVERAPYGAIFGKVWGGETFAITWPKDTAKVCARLNDGGADQAPLKLSAGDRARAMTTVKDIGLTIATFESTVASSPFSSKFDAVLAGKAVFTAPESAGYALFTGAAHCSDCHTVTGTEPLLTDFTSANIGLPHNPAVPFLTENAPDKFGYVANPAGPAFLDPGLGGFLASPADTNAQWQAQAPRFMGAFQVPTLRDVAAGKRSYMHNGYFTDLKLAVHFFNTRDALPRCTGNSGVGKTCWPAPEIAANVDTADMGNLALSEAQENALVAFMGTLTDGYSGEK